MIPCGAAPSASRTPISRCRSATTYAITPYTPTTARSSAIAAKVPTTIAKYRGSAVTVAKLSSSDVTLESGIAGSASLSAARTAFTAASVFRAGSTRTLKPRVVN